MTVLRKTVVHEMAPPKVTPGDIWAYMRRIGPKGRARAQQLDPAKYQRDVEQALDASVSDMALGYLRLIPGRLHAWRERRRTRHIFVIRSV